MGNVPETAPGYDKLPCLERKDMKSIGVLCAAFKIMPYNYLCCRFGKISENTEI